MERLNLDERAIERGQDNKRLAKEALKQYRLKRVADEFRLKVSQSREGKR